VGLDHAEAQRRCIAGFAIQTGPQSATAWVCQHRRKIHSAKIDISLRGKGIMGETERNAAERDYEE